MTHNLKAAVAAVFISAIPLVSEAQTNRVENLGFQLTVISQGAPVTTKNETNQNSTVVRAGTKDIIALLGDATTNVFSKSALLLRVTPILDGTNGPTTLIVKDGTNIVDVSGFLATSTKGSVVTNSATTKGVRTSETAYSIKTMALVDKAGYPALKTHFDLQGFVIRTLERATFRDKLTVNAHDATWTVNGTGDRNGNPLVIEGTVTIDLFKIPVGAGY